MTDQIEFKRLNFFPGMFTTAKDWNEGETYHIEKLKLHHKELHKPGVVRGLEVTWPSSNHGGSKLLVSPGVAIDDDGNIIALFKERPINLKRPEDPSKCTYVCISFKETRSDCVVNDIPKDYSGYTRYAECPVVEMSDSEPDNKLCLELARIELVADTKTENPSHDGEHPDEYRIDPSKVKRSSSTKDLETRFDVLEAGLNQLDNQVRGLDIQLAAEKATSAEQWGRLVELDNRVGDLEANLGVLAGYGRIHYRGSHTLGVMPQEGEQLKVIAAGGLNVRVLTGAALDRDGNMLIVAHSRVLTIELPSPHLPQLVFIAIRYDAARPESAHLGILANLPPDGPWVELARIDLQPGATRIADPIDPVSPGGNQIDRRNVPISGAIGVRALGMSVTEVQRIVQVMERSRRSFTELDMRFPTPSVSDTRHVCLTVATMARVGRLRVEQLADLMVTTATTEQDICRELHVKYGKLLDTTVEFGAYVRAVRSLHSALRKSDPDAILTAQDEIAKTAHELSEVAIEAPIADAGRNMELTTYGDHTVAGLDASASQGGGGRGIVHYRWTVTAS